MSLESLDPARDRFFAELSHELRAPLTPALLSVVALQRDPNLAPAMREALAMIRRNLEAEVKLIEELPAFDERGRATPVEPAQVRLLVVEDHAETAEGLARLLRRAGYRVTVAGDVAGALASAAREPFDVLVCDIALPDGSGYELLRRLRATRPVHGIALSGFGTQDDLRRSREAGFDDHLVKPIDLPKLEAAIRHAMRARE
jgi:CheY-like chemotaxis protein